MKFEFLIGVVSILTSSSIFFAVKSKEDSSGEKFSPGHQSSFSISPEKQKPIVLEPERLSES